MKHFNPLPLVFVGFCTVIGAICGATLIGLAVGLGLVFFASIASS